MIPKVAFVALLLLAAVPTGPAAAAHYVPKVGDTFTYRETIVVNDGVGSYSGYSDETWINGTEAVTAVAPNGTESAHYNTSNHWADNQGDPPVSWNPSGTYTFSATTFRYLIGTDGQTGYTNPFVWFFMNNSLAVDGSFYLLDTQFHVLSTDESYPLALSSTGYVATIYAEGTGQYQRNDSYGKFTATYDWKAYFDPSTGYIVGYQYTEQDSDGSGDGFAYADALAVTSTSYALTAASPPPATSGGAAPDPVLLLAVVLIVVVVVLVVIALALRARRRPALPRHSSTGRVDYFPGGGGAPPPVRLTPSGEPAVQQIVVKETVKVNCRYCGTLIDTTATVCPNCGAPRT